MLVRALFVIQLSGIQACTGMLFGSGSPDHKTDNRHNAADVLRPLAYLICVVPTSNCLSIVLMLLLIRIILLHYKVMVYDGDFGASVGRTPFSLI